MFACIQCGQQFEPTGHRKVVRFCSRRCSGLYTARQRGQEQASERPCAECGKPFVAMPSDRGVYCSVECRSLAARKDRPKCESCGASVRLMRNRYCSKSCSVAARPRPGVTSFSGLYARIRKANPESEPCAVCGGPGEHRHHPDYTEPERIVWLCGVCHRREHQLGKKRNTWKVRTETPILQ